VGGDNHVYGDVVVRVTKMEKLQVVLFLIDFLDFVEFEFADGLGGLNHEMAVCHTLVLDCNQHIAARCFFAVEFHILLGDVEVLMLSESVFLGFEDRSNPRLIFSCGIVEVRCGVGIFMLLLLADHLGVYFVPVCDAFL
jgi:hypothetical protein